MDQRAKVDQEVSGSGNQGAGAAGRDIRQHQADVDGGRVEVSISGTNISIGAVYANLCVQIVIEGRV